MFGRYYPLNQINKKKGQQMNFNSLFFPAPSVHYNMTTHYGEMIYIPKHFKMSEVKEDNNENQPHRPILNLKYYLEQRDLLHTKTNSVQQKFSTVQHNKEISPAKLQGQQYTPVNQLRRNKERSYTEKVQYRRPPGLMLDPVKILELKGGQSREEIIAIKPTQNVIMDHKRQKPPPLVKVQHARNRSSK